MRISRDIVLTAHRWSGLILGAAFMFVAVMGLAMVFRPQLEPFVEGSLRQVQSCTRPIALDQQVDKARDTYRAGTLRQLELSAGGHGATVVRFQDNEGVFVDPCSGAILGRQHRWGGVFNTIEQLHRWRFIENVDVAETIAGSVALILALTAVGGLVVWWPLTRRQWKSALKPKLRLKGAAFEINLHRTAGAWASGVLIATTLAALTFTFDWARQTVYALTRSEAPAKKPASAAKPGALQPMQAFLGRTLATVPQADTITLVLPRKPGDAVEAGVIERDAPHPNAKTLVFMDAYTAEVLQFRPYATSGRGNRTRAWLQSLHMGYIGGVFGQIVLFLGVLAVPVLGYTGMRGWLRRRMATLPEGKFRRQSA